MCLLGFCNLGETRNYLASEILRSQMCYLWSEMWGRRDYLGSDISGMSLSKPFSECRNWTADYFIYVRNVM